MDIVCEQRGSFKETGTTEKLMLTFGKKQLKFLEWIMEAKKLEDLIIEDKESREKSE